MVNVIWSGGFRATSGPIRCFSKSNVANDRLGLLSRLVLRLELGLMIVFKRIAQAKCTFGRNNEQYRVKRRSGTSESITRQPDTQLQTLQITYQSHRKTASSLPILSNYSF